MIDDDRDRLERIEKKLNELCEYLIPYKKPADIISLRERARRTAKKIEKLRGLKNEIDQRTRFT